MGAVFFWLAGCAIPTMEARKNRIKKMAASVQWVERVFSADLFDITSFGPAVLPNRNPVLTIYIEGDGLAWISKTCASPDPTPIRPLGLKLAMKHPDTSVLYLARPFQYGQMRNRNLRFWTSARFAPEIVHACNQILDQLKHRFRVDRFHLVGYSGGGSMAALIAAVRNDVALLVTIAANLDHDAWTRHHRVTPLKDSLNPADVWQYLTDLSQIHFIGGMDTIAPLNIADAFTSRFPLGKRPEVRLVEGAGHTDGWEDAWPLLHLESLSQAGNPAGKLLSDKRRPPETGHGRSQVRTVASGGGRDP